MVLVAPYFKVDAMETMLRHVEPGASLTCITKWEPQDIVYGASDLACRDIVIEFGGNFMLHPTLHAKYYRINDVVLIGSANLTSSAMGWSSNPNLEILCEPSSEFHADAFEREVIIDARKISDNEYLYWKSITANIARGENTPRIYPRLANWRPATRDPRHILMSYQGQGDEIASFDEQRAARRDLHDLLIPPNLTDEGLRTWMSTCLLAAPFTNSVIKLINNSDVTASYQFLASKYGLGLTEARRDMETVQTWLVYFVPKILSESI